MESNNGVSILDHRGKTITITMDGSTKSEVDRRPMNTFTHLQPWTLLTMNFWFMLLLVLCGAPPGGASRWTAKTDNQATQHLLNHGRSNSELKLNLAREFWWQQNAYDFKLNSYYINTKNNVLSDCLS